MNDELDLTMGEARKLTPEQKEKARGHIREQLFLMGRKIGLLYDLAVALDLGHVFRDDRFEIIRLRKLTKFPEYALRRFDSHWEVFSIGDWENIGRMGGAVRLARIGVYKDVGRGPRYTLEIDRVPVGEFNSLEGALSVCRRQIHVDR